ncbi:hypothetical protein P8452_25093 [Trifolium repens]|nr:hypothetical protein P8452_25093 [Trifolium repens]
MSDLPKRYDSHDDKKGKSNDDSTNSKDSSSKACTARLDEGCSSHNLLNNQQTKGINQTQHSVPKPKERDATALVPIRYIPNLTNKHQREQQFDAIKVGMEFTGVIDGSFPGGYLINVGVGNLPTMSGVAMLNSNQPARIERDVKENVPLIPTKIGLTQENQNEKYDYLRNTGNPGPCIDSNINRNSKYSESNTVEVQIPYESVVFKPVNQPTGVPIRQTNSLDKGKCISKEYYSAGPTGCGIMIDPFLHRNFSSSGSALRITPPSDRVATNLEDRSMIVPGNNILGEKGSSSDRKGKNIVAVNLVDDQQTDHAQSKHMQDNN